MKFSFNKTLIASGLALLLTACGGSAPDDKPAKQLYEEASNHLYAPNTQYNFSADVRLDGAEFEPMIKNAKITVSGAVDNAKGRVELIPEVKAAMFQVRLPISLDFKKKQLLLDPSNLLEAAQMFLPDASALDSYAGKYVRLQPGNFELDTEQQQQLNKALAMLDEGFDLFMDVQKESIATMDEKHFEKLALDDYAKQNNASAVVRVQMSAEEQKAHETAMIKSIMNRIENNQKFAEYRDDIKTALEAVYEESLNGEGSGEVDTLLYLDKKGQIIHVVSDTVQMVEGSAVKINIKMDVNNYGKAKFELTPKESDIIDFNEQEAMRLQQAAMQGGLR